MFITNKGGNANFLTEKAGSTILTLWSTFISPEMEQTDPCASVCEVLHRTPRLCCTVWVKNAEFEFNHEKQLTNPNLGTVFKITDPTLQKYQAPKNKAKLRDCSRLRNTEETSQLNLCDSGLDSGH